MNLSGCSFKYWITAAVVSKWWSAFLHNWYDTDLKKQSPPPQTSRSLKSSMLSPELNRLSDLLHMYMLLLQDLGLTQHRKSLPKILLVPFPSKFGVCDLQHFIQLHAELGLFWKKKNSGLNGIRTHDLYDTGSSVGRVLHRYRRGHCFKSRSGLNFFSGFNFTTAKVVCITAMINFKVPITPKKFISSTKYPYFSE